MSRRLDTDLVWPSHRPPAGPSKCAPPGSALAAERVQDFRLHALRHSVASYMLINGASIGELAAVLGHKTPKMVKHYSHPSEAHT